MKRCQICGDLLPKKAMWLNCGVCTRWANKQFQRFSRIQQLREVHERLSAPRIEFNIAEDYAINAMVQSIAEEV